VSRFHVGRGDNNRDAAMRSHKPFQERLEDARLVRGAYGVMHVAFKKARHPAGVENIMHIDDTDQVGDLLCMQAIPQVAEISSAPDRPAC